MAKDAGVCTAASHVLWASTGRVEFTEYFPENTQGVLVQPIGEEGLLVCGTDTQRGFGRLDQVRLIDLLAQRMPMNVECTCRLVSWEVMLCLVASF